MRPQRTATQVIPEVLAPERGILVLRGYGIDVRVWRGMLRVEDGIGKNRRAGLLHRAASGLERLVIVGHEGAITLEAIRWLDGIGASLVQLGRDAEVIGAWRAGGYERPILRRQQAKALGTQLGTELARWLICKKLEGQSKMLGELSNVVDVPARIADAIARALDGVAVAASDARIRQLEAAAANAYWSAWSAVPVRFVRGDADKVPPHWLRFGSRASAITGQPRLATNPANAMLNYLYAILETEAVLAARIMGLDPGLGVYHVDQAHRSSLAADVMEPVRASVDQNLLGLVTKRTFSIRDFFETRQGATRLTPGLATELIANGPYLGRMVGSVIEELAARLVESSGVPIPRLITRPHGKPARRVPRPKSRPISEPKALALRCPVCGQAVGNRKDRTCSETCERQARVAAGHAGLTELRRRSAAKEVGGVPPHRTAEARAKLARSQAERKRQQRDWEAHNPARPSHEVYWHDVYPTVQATSIRKLEKATGLSKTSLWRFKRGLGVPHPMWWELLRRTATDIRS